MININDKYKIFIGITIIIVGKISNYDEYHIFYILIILYISLNVYCYYLNNRNVEISVDVKQKVFGNPNIIESYYNKIENNKLIPSAPKIRNNDINIKFFGSNIDIINNYG
jgi:hypothetical protein